MGWLLTDWQMWGALGLWATALSTITAVSVALWLAIAGTRPHIKTHLHLDRDAEVLYLVAVNEGPRTVTLVHAGLRVPSTGWETGFSETSTVRLPRRLGESDFIYLRTTADTIGEGLTTRAIERGFALHGFVVDSAGREFSARYQVPAGLFRNERGLEDPGG
ncbi:MAG: hypothetical protein AB7R89_25240 [Dehalococcoidia bacterium]